MIHNHHDLKSAKPKGGPTKKEVWTKLAAREQLSYCERTEFKLAIKKSDRGKEQSSDITVRV